VGVQGPKVSRVLVDPEDWVDGDEAAELLRTHVDPARQIEVSAEPLAFESPALGLAEERIDAGDLPGALEALERGLADEPDNPLAWRMSARALHQTGSRVKAIDAIRRAIALEPEHAWSHRFLIARLGDAGHTGAALSAARDALRWHPVGLDELALAADRLSFGG